MREPTTFAPAFGDEPVGSPDRREVLKKKFPESLEDMPESCYLCICFLFSGRHDKKGFVL